MDDQTTIPHWVTRALLFGIAFFLIGIFLNDLYIVVSGLSLIIIGTIVATGEKIIQKMGCQPKGL